EDLSVHSDSAYVVNCFNQKWWVGWERKGWRTASGSQVANLDLWRPVIDHFKARKGLVFVKVKGHSGDTYNEMADVLANSAAHRMAQAK
ncbi:MAG: ribonuclease HI, partial [Actinomycetota bacterium]|nr:ribonuclease HI [Actinomycetota bacterium]